MQYMQNADYSLYCTKLYGTKQKRLHDFFFSHKTSAKHHERLFKGRVQCFSMQVVTNKCCFLLNPEKNKLAQIRLDVFEKNAHFNSEK